MKNIYDITKGQFISIWIFGVIGWFTAGTAAENGSEIGTLFALVIPFILVFYTLGYKNYKKSNSEKE